MFRPLLPVACLVALAITPVAWAQAPPAEEGARLEARLAELGRQLSSLSEDQRKGSPFVDAAVCAKAAEWILRHNEFYRPKYVESVDRVLDLGIERVEAIRNGTPDWARQPGGVALGYRSRVDGSLQPLAVTLPNDFTRDSPERWPLYVVLHGRNGTLTEASFMASFEGRPAPEGQTWIQLDVFGRTNNAYRWAGETDVFEAIADVNRRYKIDDRRITLWGFSMGGAGAWHLGLHHPSRWACVGAGAGFVDFYEYQMQTEQLPEPQHTLLGIYDTVDYALNLANVPFVTYGGEVDPQLAASLTMKRLADEADVPLRVIVGPKMGHKFDDGSRESFMTFLADHNAAGRPRSPGRREIRFVTRTLKYNECEWLRIEEQIEPFAPSMVQSRLTDGATLIVQTANVAAMAVDRAVAERISIDGGREVVLSSAADGLLPDVYFVREGRSWRLLGYDDSLEFLENPHLHKRRDLQGPIDDAFMQPFLCVTGTGQPWSQELNDYARWSLERFAADFDKYLRGEVPLVTDAEVREEDVASRNLILFGDPGSNSVLARVVDKLPLKWTRDGILVNGRTYDPQHYAPVLIYRNPLNPRKYVVVNSGMTMRAKDFKASNSWLFPKLGDIAVLKFSSDGRGGFEEETIWSALFDGRWKLSGE